ncbi:hypothetical protein [Actinoplanes sp. NPDC049681]
MSARRPDEGTQRPPATQAPATASPIGAYPPSTHPDGSWKPAAS